ncbi:hypothetical protein ACU4GD_05630 [Cupriavidus basilensis]
MMALTRCSAVEAAEFGVRINAVAPSIRTARFPAEVGAGGVAGVELALALRRSGEAAEVWGGGECDGVPGLATMRRI